MVEVEGVGLEVSAFGSLPRTGVWEWFACGGGGGRETGVSDLDEGVGRRVRGGGVEEGGQGCPLKCCQWVSFPLDVVCVGLCAAACVCLGYASDCAGGA